MIQQMCRPSPDGLMRSVFGTAVATTCVAPGPRRVMLRVNTVEPRFFAFWIGYPLGANTAHANLARVRLEYDQAKVQLRNMEMQVTTQVRGVARNVRTNQQRVQSARASRELQEKKLEAEEKKLAAGMSSPFFVVQAQRDLSLARTVEIQAISDYNKSLVDLEAVQQVPINGGGNLVQVAR